MYIRGGKWQHLRLYCFSHQMKYTNYIDRMIGVFYNSITNDPSFRRGCKLAIVVAWLFALVPMVPGAFKQFGRYGLECKTRKCTLINMDTDGDPTKLNPKAELGRWSPVVAGVFLIVFNVATVVRLRVRYIFMFKMSWKMFQVKQFFN